MEQTNTKQALKERQNPAQYCRETRTGKGISGLRAFLIMFIVNWMMIAGAPAAPRALGMKFEATWKLPEDSVAISAGADKKWTLPSLPKRTDQVAVIRFRARLNLAGAGSNNYWLAMTMNDQPIRQNVGNSREGTPRLLNRSGIRFHSSSDTNQMPYFPDTTNSFAGLNSICVLASPDFKYPLKLGEDRDDVFWYVLDVSDLTCTDSAGVLEQNILTFHNNAGPEMSGSAQDKASLRLIMDSLEAGYVPMAIATQAPLRQTSFPAVTEGISRSNAVFTVLLSRGGGLAIRVGEETYHVESQFSYPCMTNENWNRLEASNRESKSGEWRYTIDGKGAELQLSAVGKHYELRRVISIREDRVQIEDTLSNRTKEDVAIAFDNYAAPMFIPQSINVSGPYKVSYYPYCSEHPAWNPTLFFSGQRSGLGVAAIDDYYRLQLSLAHEGKTGFIRNRSFGLPAGDSYTFCWALYPAASPDYYAFINRLRRDYVPSYKLEGSGAWCPYDMAINLPPEKMAAWLRNRNARIVILIDARGAWLGGYRALQMGMKNYSLDEHLKQLKAARDKLKAIDPAVKCLAQIETPLGPDNPHGNLALAFPDSVSINPDASLAMYRVPIESEKRADHLQQKAFSYVYYPTLTNSYYRFLRMVVDRGLKEAELDGFYFDLSSYAYGNHGLRWTYDRWDHRTVDMNPDFTIRRRKADLCKLSESARAELFRTILEYKPGNVVVANEMGMAEAVRRLPVFHFGECIADYGYVCAHFSTPIMLGWTPGYSVGAEFIHKEGTWWKEWKTDADYFQDVLDKLRSACLYYTYFAPPGQMYGDSLTHPAILEHMFPITITELHAGRIHGEERIITMQSGVYSWHDNSATVGYFYDAEGRACEGKLRKKTAVEGTASSSPVTSFEIEVPNGGAAVLERVLPPDAKAGEKKSSK